MPQLTDTQLVILSATAFRENGSVFPLPKSLKARGAALNRSLEALRAKGFLEEQPTTPDAEYWREASDGRRMTLLITEDGQKAIDGAPSTTAPKRTNRPKGRVKKEARGRTRDAPPLPAPRQGSKLAQVIDLLKRDRGARINDLVKATGWQPHTVRAALTGLRKRGIDVTRERNDGITTYYAKAV
jgi:DNA-binding MarR family transcriptional regulator